MRRVEGSLATGTYLVFTRPNNEELLANAKERSNGAGHEISSTMNRNDENVEVCTMSTTTCMSHPSLFLVVL